MSAIHRVLVQHDMLGMFDRFAPKFCKQYADMSSLAVAALEQYAAEVRGRTFPALQHTYPMEEKEFRRFLEMMAEEKKNVTTKSDSFQPSMPLSSIENNAKSSNK